MSDPKFKVWDPSTNSMSQGFYLEDPSGGYIDGIDMTKEGVIKREYIKHKDKNNVEIYDKDIVRYTLLGQPVNRLVEFINDRWDAGAGGVIAFEDMEVIGNLFQNPELLQSPI